MAILDLIEAAENEIAMKRMAEEAKRLELLDIDRTAMRKALDPVWDEISAYVVEEKDFHRKDDHLRWRVNAQDMGLVPFYVYPPERGSEVTITSVDNDGGTYFPARLHQALREFKMSFADWTQKKREENIQELKRQLSYFQVQDDGQALDIFHKLVQLAPEEDWEGVYAEWCSRRDAIRENERRDLEYKANNARVETEWREACAAYWTMYYEVVAQRRAILEQLQDQVDGNFVVYKLKYGVVASEDGEVIVDTDRTWVAEQEPDEQGFWSVMDHGEISKVKFMHPVSVTEVTLRITDQKAFGVVNHKYFNDPTFTLSWLGCDPNLSALPEVPERPIYPEGYYGNSSLERIDNEEQKRARHD